MKKADMPDWNLFLKECVYYPCSHLHGTPIKFLSHRFQNFVYCDYLVTRDELQHQLDAGGFAGYRLTDIVDVDSLDLLGTSWDDFIAQHHANFAHLPPEWADPFISLCTFRRQEGFPQAHGAEMFNLLFVRAEAVSTFVSAFSRRQVSPRCLVHVRSGIGFGGNFRAYPALMEAAVRANPGGLPDFLFHDAMGADPNCGDYLSLVEEYREVQTWGYPDGGYLRLAEHAG